MSDGKENKSTFETGSTFGAESTFEEGNPETPRAVEWLTLKVPFLRGPIYFFWYLSRHWSQDQCTIKAAAMAFFGFLSIFPMILAAVSILATMLAGNSMALETFQEFVEQFFPGPSGNDISLAMGNAIDKIADGPNATTLGIIALGSLLWSGRAFFATLAQVLNSVWPGTRTRTFFQNQMVLWGTFLGAGVLWLLSTFSMFLNVLVYRVTLFLPGVLREGLPWLDIASRSLSFLLTVLMFWLIYRFLPNVSGSRRPRLIWGAALLAALGWETAKITFTQFLGNLDRYQAIYGSVAGVIVTLMWIYVSSLIILLGAEAAASYEEATLKLKQLREKRVKAGTYSA